MKNPFHFSSLLTGFWLTSHPIFFYEPPVWSIYFMKVIVYFASLIKPLKLMGSLDGNFHLIYQLYMLWSSFNFCAIFRIICLFNINVIVRDCFQLFPVKSSKNLTFSLDTIPKNIVFEVSKFWACSKSREKTQ